MKKHIENKHWPCKEKKCWRCCDPVKIAFRKGVNPSDIPAPKDDSGNPLWIPLQEVRAPEKNIDTVRVQVYKCLLYDKNTKLCTNYENRPEICRNTSCIDDKSQETIDEQHKKSIQTDFIKMKE